MLHVFLRHACRFLLAYKVSAIRSFFTSPPLSFHALATKLQSKDVHEMRGEQDRVKSITKQIKRSGPTESQLQIDEYHT